MSDSKSTIDGGRHKVVLQEEEGEEAGYGTIIEETPHEMMVGAAIGAVVRIEETPHAILAGAATIEVVVGAEDNRAEVEAVEACGTTVAAAATNEAVLVIEVHHRHTTTFHL